MPSDASVVLMLPMSAPGLVASVSVAWIELIVVMTDEIAEEAVSSTDWLCVSAELAAVTMPLAELSCVADRPVGGVVGGAGDRQAGRNLVLGLRHFVLRHLQRLQRAERRWHW